MLVRGVMFSLKSHLQNAFCLQFIFTRKKYINFTQVESKRADINSACNGNKSLHSPRIEDVSLLGKCIFRIKKTTCIILPVDIVMYDFKK